MGYVDVADQLRNQYRFYHSLRNFLLGMQVIMANTYVCYTAYIIIEGVDKKYMLAHYEFQKHIALA